jgi:hypothetical protein
LQHLFSILQHLFLLHFRDFVVVLQPESQSKGIYCCETNDKNNSFYNLNNIRYETFALFFSASGSRVAAKGEDAVVATGRCDSTSSGGRR